MSPPPLLPEHYDTCYIVHATMMTRLFQTLYRQKHYVKPGLVRDQLTPVPGNEAQPSPSPHEATTPINLVQRLTLKSLKGYSSLVQGKEQRWSTLRDIGRTAREARASEGGRQPHTPAKDESVAVSGKESLYTFYTNDEDLVAKGKKMYSSATLATLAGTGSFGEPRPSGMRGRGRRRLWDAENIDVRRSRVKDPNVVSQVYRELILHPNHYYESEVVRQWMLERCGPAPTTRSRDVSRGGRGATTTTKASYGGRAGEGRGFMADYNTGGAGGRDDGDVDTALKYTWPLHFTEGGVAGGGRRGGRGNIHEEYYYRYYKLATTTTTTTMSGHPQTLYNPLCTEGGVAGMRDRYTSSSGGECKVHHGTSPGGHHSPLYEWSGVYPVVMRKPAGAGTGGVVPVLVVDKSRPPGFQSKPHPPPAPPLPPIDAAALSAGGHVTHTHGHHVRIVRIKLPKLQV